MSCGVTTFPDNKDTQKHSVPGEYIKAAIFSFERVEHACAYIRLVSPLERLAGEVDYAWGVSHQQASLFRKRSIHTGYLDFADIVVVQRTFPQKRTVKAMNKILSSGKPVIYDTDDLLFDLPHDHVLSQPFEKYKPYILDFMRRADAVTVSTPALAEAVRSFNSKTHVLPNLVDDALWSTSSHNTTGKIVIGFSGSSTHAGDIAMIEEALLTIASRHGDRVAFKFLGCVTEPLANLPCVDFIDFQPSYRDYAHALMGAGIDIAVVPLENTHFNRCKSNIKWLEYSACGIPGVYSDILPYNSCVANGRTGILADAGTGAWVDALEELITREELRRAIGREAQQDVSSRFSLSNRACIYSDFYRSMVSDARQTRKGALRKRLGCLFKRSPFKH